VLACWFLLMAPLPLALKPHQAHTAGDSEAQRPSRFVLYPRGHLVSCCTNNCAPTPISGYSNPIRSSTFPISFKSSAIISN